MKLTLQELVGKRVLHRHRQDCDLPESYRKAYHGTVLSVEEGCNPTIHVQFDGLEFPSMTPVQDLALIELWPKEGCDLNDVLDRN